MNRRNVLKMVGGGLVLAAGSGAIFAATRTPQSALAPWSRAGAAEYSDPRMHALSHAILAPNPHNRQPWLVELVGSDQIALYFDTDRQLPHTDPFDRQLTIGLGCFLELMKMAANANGHAVELDLFPEGENPEGLDKRPIALARFRPDDGVTVDPLWQHVMNRRSNKEPYDTARTVPQSVLDAIISSGANGTDIGGTVKPEEIVYWRKLTEKALLIEIETPRTYAESVELFRIGKSEIEANPDGIDFSGPMFETLALTGMFSRESAMDRNSMAYQGGIDAVLENTRTAMGHVWMITRTNTRRDQIAAGADWLRVNLAATAQGLGFQPLSQALQEYPEMQDLFRETHTRLASEGGTVQMLSRIGFGPAIAASPRWPIDAKLVSA